MLNVIEVGAKVDIDHVGMAVASAVSMCVGRLVEHPIAYDMGLADGREAAPRALRAAVEKLQDEGSKLEVAVTKITKFTNGIDARPLPLPVRDLPVRMFVSAKDVVATLGCSPSTAHKLLRDASGRTVGTGELLRVDARTWEQFMEKRLRRGKRGSRIGGGR